MAKILIPINVSPEYAAIAHCLIRNNHQRDLLISREYGIPSYRNIEDDLYEQIAAESSRYAEVQSVINNGVTKWVTQTHQGKCPDYRNTPDHYFHQLEPTFDGIYSVGFNEESPIKSFIDTREKSAIEQVAEEFGITLSLEEKMLGVYFKRIAHDYPDVEAAEAAVRQYGRTVFLSDEEIDRQITNINKCIEDFATKTRINQGIIEEDIYNLLNSHELTEEAKNILHRPYNAIVDIHGGGFTNNETYVPTTITVANVLDGCRKRKVTAGIDKNMQHELTRDYGVVFEPRTIWDDELGAHATVCCMRIPTDTSLEKFREIKKIVNEAKSMDIVSWRAKSEDTRSWNVLSEDVYIPLRFMDIMTFTVLDSKAAGYSKDSFKAYDMLDFDNVMDNLINTLEKQEPTESLEER